MKGIRKKTVGSLMGQIERQLKRIGVERDKLRELISQADEVIQSCDDAMEDFGRGLDTLSQYV